MEKTSGNPTWTTPSFINGWGDAGNCGYRKLIDGTVELYINVSGGTADNTVAFYLPEGYRPDFNMTIVGAHTAADVTKHNSMLSIGYDGSVNIDNNAAPLSNPTSAFIRFMPN